MKIDSIYKHFLLTRASHLPVVDDKGEIQGLISKARIQEELSELGEERKEWDRIPSHLLEKHLHESVLTFFRENTRIPVLNHSGERKEFWDKPRFLAEFSKLTTAPEPKPQEGKITRDDTKAPKEPVHWFMELILSHFPEALLATDLEGNTILYNEVFESHTLKKNFFKDSIGHAEKILRELNKELVATKLQSNELSPEALESGSLTLTKPIPELGALLKIVPLSAKKKLVGYLYHFAPEKEGRAGGQGGNPSGSLPPFLPNSRQSLPEYLETVEASWIEKLLKANQFNVSHTAKALGIPRTTLQNRMKYLKLPEIKTPVIPRKRQKPSPPPKKSSKPAKKSKKRR